MHVLYKGKCGRELTVFDAAQMDDMFYECMMSEYETQQKGMVVIFDFHDFPWSSMKWAHPKYARAGAAKSELIPIKQLYFHIVNTSPLLSAVIKAVKPLLSKKVLDMVRLCI